NIRASSAPEAPQSGKGEGTTGWHGATMLPDRAACVLGAFRGMADLRTGPIRLGEGSHRVEGGPLRTFRKYARHDLRIRGHARRALAEAARHPRAPPATPAGVPVERRTKLP